MKHYSTRTNDNRFTYLIKSESSFKARQAPSARTRGNVPCGDFMAVPVEVRIAPIPFAGFYNSQHEYELDRAIELLTQDDNGDPISDELDRMQSAIDWRIALFHYAKLYSERLADETGAQWEFERLDSPREYNYRSDEIDVTVSLPELQRMLDVIEPSALQDLATKRLTPRSGFIPFYPSDVEQWGELPEWDSPLLGLLIECYCDAMDQDREARDWWLVDDDNGDVTACIEAALKY